MCLYRGRLASFTSNCPRNRPLAWRVRFWDMDRPWYWVSAWKVPTPGSRTIHDMRHYRGRFASEIWTVRDIETQRGWFGPGEWNRPRNRPVVWKVDIAEEAAFAMGLCGSLLWSLSGYVNDGTAAGIKHEATEKGPHNLRIWESHIWITLWDFDFSYGFAILKGLFYLMFRYF